MTPPTDLSTLSPSEKDTLISVLMARLDALEAENALLREQLNLPPKTPDNSCKPPSQGQKPNGESKLVRVIADCPVGFASRRFIVLGVLSDRHS
ncbi:MAG: hypothetical protein AB7E55_27500 [Pigmentiphaga sp.]